jgi:hypothetical protein
MFHIAEQRREPIDRHGANGVHLLLDHRLIPWSIADEIRNLAPDQRAEGKDDRQCNDNGKESGRDAAEVNST